MNKHGWRDYQQAQLDEYCGENIKLTAAFPGSMLFTHILVPLSGDVNSKQMQGGVDVIVPDVSDLVYEYCTRIQRDEEYKNALVIDSDEPQEAGAVLEGVKKVIDDTSARRIILLGKNTDRFYGGIFADGRRNALTITMIEPDWSQAAVLHSIYRQASKVVFVNSMRVLDAAYTGCACILITDGSFRQNPVFPVLQRKLKQAGCDVLDEYGRMLSCLSKECRSNYLIVNNSRVALDTALRQASNQIDTSGGLIGTESGDRLSAFSAVDSDPVITPHSPKRSITARLRDRKTRWHRKLSKLLDDPRAFFTDSRSRVIRGVGRLVFSTRQTG